MKPNQVNVKIELENAGKISEIITGIDGQDDYNDDDEKPSCRLCFGTAHDDSDLIEPCLCRGTIAKVHRKCLEKWLNVRGITKCDLCLFELPCKIKLRYGLFESIGIWIQQKQHPLTALTTLIFMVVAILMVTYLLRNIFDLLTNEGIAERLSPWNSIFFGTALTMWVGIYSMICFIITNEQIRPWYRWWKSKKQIKIAIKN